MDWTVTRAKATLDCAVGSSAAPAGDVIAKAPLLVVEQSPILHPKNIPTLETLDVVTPSRKRHRCINCNSYILSDITSASSVSKIQ